MDPGTGGEATARKINAQVSQRPSIPAKLFGTDGYDTFAQCTSVTIGPSASPMRFA